MIVHTKLRDLVMDTAETEEIPVQFSFMERGGTDGMKIQQHHEGVPTIVIAVTARHIHSHNSIIHRDDFDNAVKLVTAVVRKLNAATVKRLHAYE
jgi:endoglucanase